MVKLIKTSFIEKTSDIRTEGNYPQNNSLNRAEEKQRETAWIE
jgi:hypothetical protein